MRMPAQCILKYLYSTVRYLRRLLLSNDYSVVLMRVFVFIEFESQTAKDRKNVTHSMNYTVWFIPADFAAGNSITFTGYVGNCQASYYYFHRTFCYTHKNYHNSVSWYRKVNTRLWGKSDSGRVNVKIASHLHVLDDKIWQMKWKEIHQIRCFAINLFLSKHYLLLLFQIIQQF